MKRMAVSFCTICLLVSVQCLGALPVADGLVMHLDAGSISGVANGAAIDTWADLSGIGNNATQAIADNQPVFIASSSEFNGNAVVRFDGLSNVAATGDWMTLPSTTCLVNSFTAFVVAKYDEITPIALGGHNMYIMDGAPTTGTGGNTNGRMRFQLDGSANPSFFEFRAGNAGFKKGIATADTDIHVFAMTSVEEGFLDGVSMGVFANTATGSPDRLNIGSFDRGAKDFFDGDMAEVIIFNRVLSASEVASMNDYLADKYIVPEPATIALLGLGALALRRKK